jgi:hypothetical protein
VALLSFPNSPANNQLYPTSPLVGQNQYQWDSTDQVWKLLGSATGVAAGTYGDSLNVGQFTVDAQGRITFADNVTIATPGSTPAGLNRYIQFNDNGSFGASPNFTWNSSSNTLTVSKVSSQTTQTVNFSSYATESNFLTLQKDSFGNGRELKFSGPLGIVTLTTGPSANAYTMRLPNTQGGAQTVLTNDGTGNLSWSPSVQMVPIPANSSSSGLVGQVAVGGGFFYWFNGIQWLRVAGSTF